jgi:DNA-binding beta-propeller fold protein YncE
MAGTDSIAWCRDELGTGEMGNSNSVIAWIARSGIDTGSIHPWNTGCIDPAGATCAGGNALADQRSVAVSPDGKSVYVASVGSNAVGLDPFGRETIRGGRTR